MKPVTGSGLSMAKAFVSIGVNGRIRQGGIEATKGAWRDVACKLLWVRCRRDGVDRSKRDDVEALEGLERKNGSS